MAIRIKARSGESSEQMLRRFKKLCEKEGLTKEVKKKQYYEKPSERARRDSRRSVKRVEMAGAPRTAKGPGGPRAGGGRAGGPGGRGPAGRGPGGGGGGGRGPGGPRR